VRELVFDLPGEMARRCRELDWAATPLGPVSGWSRSLCALANAVVASRNPMLLFWGPELVQIYNDAFRPSLGPETGAAPRHPRALGMAAAEFWTDVWETVGPQIAGVMERGEAVWFENLYLPIERGEGVLDDAWWIYSYSPVRDDDGTIGGTLVVCLETTEAVRANAAVEAANRAKSDFLAMMSHELRTPLSAIEGYAHLLEEEAHGPLTEAQRRDVTRIRGCGRHLLGMINQILDYARAEAGALVFDRTDVSVDEVLRTCEAVVAPSLLEKRLELRLPEVPAGLGVHADSDKLRQIVLNLLTNGVKFTDPGGTIEIACERRGDEVALSVNDNGCGMDTDQLERIFEPFVQLAAARSASGEGVGLGLAISRQLALGMKGDLTVESSPGVGSTFTLVLPATSARRE
jgi:signal transduction histidine kinase